MKSEKAAYKLDNYDDRYRQEDYWRYRPWLYRSLVRALLKTAQLREGASVLDAGCGQGFFSGLIAEGGFKTLGVDMSKEGVRRASETYGRMMGVAFEAGDVLELPYVDKFDCVFTRSLSPYNTDDFESDQWITDALMRYLKPGGVFIFDYYTRLNRAVSVATWRHHSMVSVRRHFAPYPCKKIYFSSRLDAILLGRFALSPPMTWMNSLVSRSVAAIGGEALALVWKK